MENPPKELHVAEPLPNAEAEERVEAAPRSRLRFPRRSRARGAVTAIDTDGRMLWVAQASPRGAGSKLTRVREIALKQTGPAGAADPDELGKAIGQGLKQLGLHPGTVVLGAPRNKHVLRLVSVPAVDDLREMASMVQFQVTKDLPFSTEEAVIDFAVHGPSGRRPSESGGAADPKGAGDKGTANDAGAAAKVDVLAVVANRETVSLMERIAGAAGLKCAGLGFKAAANARCLQQCLGAGGGDKPEPCVALVTVEAEGVHVDVVFGGLVLFSRSAPLPALPPEPPSGSPAAVGPGAATREGWVSSLTIEAARSLHGYAGVATGRAVERVYVCGSTGVEPDVCRAIAGRTSVPCEVLDPAVLLGMQSTESVAARGAVTAIGLALSGADAAGLPVDFLHPKKPAVQRNTRRLKLLAGMAAAVAVLLVVLAVRMRMVNASTAVLKDLQFQLAEAEKKRPVYRAMKQQAATLQDWLKNPRDWLDHYAYLSAILPSSEDVYVTSISVSGPSIIRLAVQARGGEILSRLDKQLRAAGYEVKPLAITPGADRHGYDFRSTVELVIPDKMKLDLSKVKAPARPMDDASLDPGAAKGVRP